MTRPLVVAALAAGLLFAGRPTLGAVPDFVAYSGRLTDGTAWGQSTTLDLTFRIYDQAEGGALLLEQSFADAPVEDGYFSVMLAGVAGLFGAHDQTWVTVCVGEGCLEADELMPRQAVGSVPYAVGAAKAEWADSFEVKGDLAVAGQSTLGGRPFRSTAAMDLHVGPDGSDVTGDGTPGNPWKTLQFAVDHVPWRVDHVVTIHVAAGFYPAQVSISGLSGKGELRIVGDAEAIQSRSLEVSGINGCGVTISGCSLPMILLEGLLIKRVGGQDNNGVCVTASSWVRILNCEIAGYLGSAGNQNRGVRFKGSMGRLDGVHFHSNLVSLEAQNQSLVSAHENLGGGSVTTGYMSSYGSLMQIAVPIGGLKPLVCAGGMIIDWSGKNKCP